MYKHFSQKVKKLLESQENLSIWLNINKMSKMRNAQILGKRLGEWMGFFAIEGESLELVMIS